MCFFFDEQFDNNLITPGKYRQRSYDNLKMGKCSSSSDVNCTVQTHLPSSQFNYRLSTNLSKINNEEQINHRHTPSSTRLNSPVNAGTDRNVLSSSLVKLTPHIPTQYKVYGPQKKYKLKNVIDAYGTRTDRQSAHNINNNKNDNDNNRERIDRWTAERLVLLRGDDMLSNCIAADTDNGNHIIDQNDAVNSKIT